jgi:hypothetical protein
MANAMAAIRNRRSMTMRSPRRWVGLAITRLQTRECAVWLRARTGETSWVRCAERSVSAGLARYVIVV